MPHPVRHLVGLLTILLAGCQTQPRRNGAYAPDWQAEGVAAETPPSPAHGTALEDPPAVNPVLAKLTTPVEAGQTARATNASARDQGVARAPAAQSSAPAARAETWVPLNRWCKANGLAEPCRLGAATSVAYALSTTNGVFVLRPGSREAQWNGLDVGLGFAPQLINGQPFIHSLDLEKTVVPLLGAPGTEFFQLNRLIVIDPGHGGEDSGARSVLGNHYEKDFALDWARRLASLLASNGWQVLLTRTTDCELALSNRVAFAQQHQAGLFVSLHFNSADGNDHLAGLETYCLTPVGLPSNLTRQYADDRSLTFPNNAFDTQNLQLAVRVHRELLQVNEHRDRGVRRARFPTVLRGQSRPAILIEGGYLSNPREARRIADPSYRQKLAEAVARALGRRET